MRRDTLELGHQAVLDHVQLAAHVAELPEWDNSSHLRRIRRYAYILAMGAGMDHPQAELVATACMLHDIGKIRLPASIVTKTARLEPDEYVTSERHTVEGSRILEGSDSPILEAAKTIALTHHERWDGSGYPGGLRGEAIPTTGRIMALVDVFDALTSKRPYKMPMEPGAAFDLVKDSSGTLFDPELVNVFVQKFDEFLAVLRSERGSTLPVQ